MSQSESARGWLTSLLKGLGQNGVYLDPGIPPKKLTNAFQSCGIPPETTVIGLIDTTVLGSAKDCIVFGEDRIWYHNQYGSAGSFSYSELASMRWERVTIAGFILSSNGAAIYIGGIPKDKALEFFRHLSNFPSTNTPIAAATDTISEKSGEASEVPQAETVLDLLGADSHLREEKILEVLRSTLPQSDLYLIPDIPADKLDNARQSCALPPHEKVLGLLDCTIKGSAKNALIFGLDGIYWHNDFTAKKLG
jgi:hypothetical protein